MTKYAIGLGSNIGDRLEHLRSAVEQLDGLGEVSDASSLYETAPVGGPEQDPFLNAAVILHADLEPPTLLDQLHEVEKTSGRERAVRWGPRTLDLDILAWDGPEVATEGLRIPHPRAGEREFVLRPLVEVWPRALIGPGRPADAALASVEAQGVDRLARTWIDEQSPWPGRVFVAVQFAWFLGIALAMGWDGSLPGGSAGATRLVGVPLTVAGAALAFISSRRLGANLTAVPEPRSDATLVDTGPYRWARHPIYGGATLFILGTTLILDSFTGALLSLGLLPFFYLKTEYEERRLRIHFPQYRAYRQRVTRRLIPFLI